MALEKADVLPSIPPPRATLQFFGLSDEFVAMQHRWRSMNVVSRNPDVIRCVLSTRATTYSRQMFEGHADLSFELRITNQGTDYIGLGILDAKATNKCGNHLAGEVEVTNSVSVLLKGNKVYILHRDKFIFAGQVPASLLPNPTISIHLSKGIISFNVGIGPWDSFPLEQLNFTSCQIRIGVAMSQVGQEATIARVDPRETSCHRLQAAANLLRASHPAESHRIAAVADKYETKEEATTELDSSLETACMANPTLDVRVQTESNKDICPSLASEIRQSVDESSHGNFLPDQQQSTLAGAEADATLSTSSPIPSFDTAQENSSSSSVQRSRVPFAQRRMLQGWRAQGGSRGIMLCAPATWESAPSLIPLQSAVNQDISARLASRYNALPHASKDTLVLINTANVATEHDMKHSAWPQSYQQFHKDHVIHPGITVVHVSGFIWNGVDVTVERMRPPLERTLLFMSSPVEHKRSFAREGKEDNTVRALGTARICDVARVIAILKRFPNSHVYAVDFQTNVIIPGQTLFEDLPQRFGLVQMPAPARVLTACIVDRDSAREGLGRALSVIDTANCADVARQLTSGRLTSSDSLSCAEAMGSADFTIINIYSTQHVTVILDNGNSLSLPIDGKLPFPDAESRWCRQRDGKYVVAVLPFLDGELLTRCKGWRIHRTIGDAISVWVPQTVNRPSAFLSYLVTTIEFTDPSNCVLLHRRDRCSRVALHDAMTMDALHPRTLHVASGCELVNVHVKGYPSIVVHVDDQVDATATMLSIKAGHLAWRRIIVSGHKLRWSSLISVGMTQMAGDDDLHFTLSESFDEESMPQRVGEDVAELPLISSHSSSDEQSLDFVERNADGNAHSLTAVQIERTLELEVVTDVIESTFDISSLTPNAETPNGFRGTLYHAFLATQKSGVPRRISFRGVSIAWVDGVSPGALQCALQLRAPLLDHLFAASGIYLNVENGVVAVSRTRDVRTRWVQVSVFCRFSNTCRKFQGSIPIEIPCLADKIHSARVSDVSSAALRWLGFPRSCLTEVQYRFWFDLTLFTDGESLKADDVVPCNAKRIEIFVPRCVSHNIECL